ncbi:hypothetical protein BpHYR1_038532 [Brachionus plicatilis]|uniref:Uncharacterized protein n=1 Tax=Brachionus plicatilis TaxID=10195 RepID=A0A3M7QSZ8_BRAPC|nr:hypothetical protein BpHYR1_038532 [Brachionus plicatilis]
MNKINGQLTSGHSHQYFPPNVTRYPERLFHKPQLGHQHYRVRFRLFPPKQADVWYTDASEYQLGAACSLLGREL